MSEPGPQAQAAGGAAAPQPPADVAPPSASSDRWVAPTVASAPLATSLLFRAHLTAPPGAVKWTGAVGA